VIKYKRKRVSVERVFDVEGPDTPMVVYTAQAGDGGHRVVRRTNVKSRTLTLITYNDPGSVYVDYVMVEGRVVRKSDGQLGASKTVGFAAKNWDGRRDELPRWIEEIIAAEGLKY
jgi:hypothetical protein